MICRQKKIANLSYATKKWQHFRVFSSQISFKIIYVLKLQLGFYVGCNLNQRFITEDEEEEAGEDWSSVRTEKEALQSSLQKVLI